MTRQLASRISVAAFAVVVLYSLLGAIFPAKPCDARRSFEPGIVALELARSQDDLTAIFHGADCKTDPVAPLRAFGVWGDTLVFIQAYALFLIFFFAAVAPRDLTAARLGALLAAAAAIADHGENIALAHILDAPDAAGAWLSALEGLTVVKWLALGVAGAVGGTILLRSGRVNYPAAAACALGLIGVVLAMAAPHLFGPYLLGAVALSWLSFLPVVVRGALSRGAA